MPVKSPMRAGRPKKSKARARLFEFDPVVDAWLAAEKERTGKPMRRIVQDALRTLMSEAA
jgi:hypothetical protein